MPKVNISIDDVSPHPMSSHKVLDQCYKLIEKFPDIKFTLFIPTAYWRTKGNTATQNPLILTDNYEFCQILRTLSTNNFELGYHGFYHGIPNINNNDEFERINYNNAKIKFQGMKDITTKANLKFKPIFRPPAWKMCPDAINAAIDQGIEILALADLDYAINTYKDEYKQAKVVWATSFPPFRPLKLEKNTAIVYHACEWDKNYLDKKKTEELICFLKNEENNYCFMGEMI